VTGWLLDADILSGLRRPHPGRKVVAFVAAQAMKLLHVSTVTLTRIRSGIESLDGATRRGELTDWLTHKVLSIPGNRSASSASSILGHSGPGSTQTVCRVR
jgi:predicted nucleic acid-binding protein